MRRLGWLMAIAILSTVVFGPMFLLRIPPATSRAVVGESRTRPQQAVPDRPPSIPGPAEPEARSTRDLVSGSMARPERRAAPPAGSAPGQDPVEVRDRLEAAFQAGGVTIQSDLGRALSSELPGALPVGSQIRQIECRRAFCRVETSHTSADAFQEFMNRAFRGPSTTLVTGPVFAGPAGVHGPGDPLVAVAYVAEYGQSLPMRTVD